MGQRNLVLVAHMLKHTKIKWLGEVKSICMDLKKMLINFRKKVTVSMTICMGGIANQGKVPKWLPLKNYKLKSLNI